MQRESMEVDVVIVGAGPAGLATACKLLQLAQAGERELTVCVLEKGSEIGAHILSRSSFRTQRADGVVSGLERAGRSPANSRHQG